MIQKNVMIGLTTVGLAILATAGGASADEDQSKCIKVAAHMVEDRSTTGCKPTESSCFLGEVKGPGLHATTHFKGDSGAAGPSTSPGWISYSGLFEYTSNHGTIVARETGAVNVTQGNVASGATTAFQLITGGTGIFTGATGYFFVRGFNVDDHVETEVDGKICLP